MDSVIFTAPASMGEKRGFRAASGLLPDSGLDSLGCNGGRAIGLSNFLRSRTSGFRFTSYLADVKLILPSGLGEDWRALFGSELLSSVPCSDPDNLLGIESCSKGHPRGGKQTCTTPDLGRAELTHCRQSQRQRLRPGSLAVSCSLLSASLENRTSRAQAICGSPP